ncbi:MAG: hypothetical protein ACREMY_30115, partial [bacterium]
MTTALPVETHVKKIKELGEITDADVAHLIDTSPDTRSRWSTDNIAPEHERLRRLIELQSLLTEL